MLLSYKEVEIALKDERSDREKTFYFEGGIASFVSRLNKNKAVVHPDPIYLSAMIDSTIVETALQYNAGFAELKPYATGNHIRENVL